MLPEIWKRGLRIGAALLGAWLCLLSNVALAAPHVTVDLLETETGFVVRLRGLDPATAALREGQVTRDKKHYFVPDHAAAKQRLFGSKDHRLDFVEVDTKDDAVVIKLQQHPKYEGKGLAPFVDRQQSGTGFDIYVYDKEAPRPLLPPKAVSASVLEKALAEGEAPRAPEPADADAQEQALGDSTDLLAAAEPADEAPAEDGEQPTDGDFLAATTADDAPEKPSTVSSLRALIPALSGLAALAFAAFVLVRKRNGQRFGAEPTVDVVSRVAIGPRQQIVHVRTAGRELLLGVTEHQVTLLTHLGGEISASLQLTDSGAIVAAPVTASAHPVAGAATKAPKDNPTQARVDAFKRRLREALGAEAQGKTPEAEQSAIDELPPHLAMLQQQQRDPEWTRREDVA